MKSIENLIGELEHVAKKNKDGFRYRIEIVVQRSGITYQFFAEETADGHMFVSGGGSTIEEAVQNAHRDVPDSIEEWGYET